ncbi:MAG: AAA family ATPase [Proteobacteria bacterium]|nr:AAA family ATPase [Pseudomonadota bacterium]
MQPNGAYAAKRLLRVWRRHLGLFLGVFVVLAAIGVAVVFSLKPTYTATATVVLTTQNADPLAAMGQQPMDVVGDDRAATEAARLQSRDVAAAVLHEFPPPPAAPRFQIRNWLCTNHLTFLCKKPPPSSPGSQQEGEINAFLSKLTVSPELHSRVLDVSVTANDGQRAATLANAVVTNYQTLALQQQTADVNRVASWLDARTEELRQRWLDAVNKANAFDVAQGLTNTGNGQASDPLVNSQIAETAVNLSAAQAKLAAAQARADALQAAAHGGRPGSLLEAAQQPIVVASANALSQLESERRQQEAEFGRNYPGVRALNQQIASTRASLRSATSEALGNIRENLVAARAEVKQLTSYLNSLRDQAGRQSAPQAQFRSLSQEAQSAQTVYQTFLDHSKEVVDRAALLQPPVAFVSHAAVPGSPTFPNHGKLLAGVAIVSIVLALAAVLLADYLSVGFGDVDDLRGAVQLPLLTAIPFVSASGRRLIARHVLDDPFSRASEAVRGLAAQLSLMVRDGDRPRSVLVTSASAEEGKTTLVVWLALTVRMGGQRVIVVDGDHRRGSLNRHMSGSTKLGLTDLLAGHATLAEVIQTDPDTDVDFIGAGRPMTNSFGTRDIMNLRAIMTALKTSYGLVIVDSPPLLAMTDGLVHASIVDQTIFICRWQSTSRRAVVGCIERLRAYGAQIPGIVVSMVDQKSTLALGDDYSRREMKLINKLYGS